MTAVEHADLAPQPVISVALYGGEGLPDIVIKPGSCVGGSKELKASLQNMRGFQPAAR